jgi:hypothetical protein
VALSSQATDTAPYWSIASSLIPTTPTLSGFQSGAAVPVGCARDRPARS